MKTDRSYRFLRQLGAVFLVSSAALAYQIVLTRLFSIAQWHHFAHMIISIAMLGFAAAGALLALPDDFSQRQLKLLLKSSLFLASLLFPLTYLGARLVPFETFRLTTQPEQIIYLFGLYLLLSLPFFFASAFLTLSFMQEKEKIGLIYFSNMLGSGAGALAAALLLFQLPVSSLPYLLGFLTALGLLLILDNWRELLALLAVIFTLCLVFFFFGFQQVPISSYKSLNYGLQNPDAEIVGQNFSPLSQVTAVRSRQIRATPGQISNYPYHKYGDIPEQIVLYFDGNSPSPIIRFDGDYQNVAYLDYVTAALPFHLDRTAKDAAVVGAGGGSSVLQTLAHEPESVTAIEVDPVVHQLLRDDFAEFSGQLYHHPAVHYVLADGRGYFQSKRKKYDLIQFPLLDAFNAAAAGTNALAESYLYTRESLQLYLDRLADDGLLSFTRWLRTPPRDFIKIIATAVEALEAQGIEKPENHIIALRSWNTGTLVVSKSPFTESEIARARQFAEDRWFDFVHFPGMQAEQANRFVLLEEPEYYLAVQQILSPEREKFYQDHHFYLRPASDDRPYFHHFFRWHSFRLIWEQLGTRSLRYLEWGYLILTATVIQAFLAAAIFILLPLWFFGDFKFASPISWFVVLYFASLGVGYMLLEMVMIQRLMLFLTYPVYSLAVVLTSFLCFSGAGSFFAHKCRTFPLKTVATAVAVIGFLALGYHFSFPLIFSWAAGWPDYAKISLAVTMIAPLAFALGFPFPLGLQTVADHNQRLIPWAWGINGSLSVVGAGLATLLSVHFGFSFVTAIAFLIYLIALAGFSLLLQKL